MSFRITLIRTSLSVSVASWAFSLASIAMFMAWPATPIKVPSLSRATRGLATGTAITTSAQVWRATSTGTLRTSMPSTSSRPSCSTGANAPGTAMLARIATARSPLSNTTISPFSRGSTSSGGRPLVLTLLLALSLVARRRRSSRSRR